VKKPNASLTGSSDSDFLRDTELSEQASVVNYSGMIISRRLWAWKTNRFDREFARKLTPTHFCRIELAFQKPLATLDISDYNGRRWQIFAILV
jgi:hypothetical protein